MHRRDWLKRVGATGFVAVPTSLLGDVETSHEHAIRALVGNNTIKPDTRIELHVPHTAANGAVVPVGVVSAIPDTQKIVLLVDNHPRSKVAELDTSNPMLAPQLSAHLQLQQAATVTALIKAKSGWYSQSTKVTSLGETCEL